MRSRYAGIVPTLIWPIAAALVLAASGAAWPTANSPSSQDIAAPAIVLAADAKELALTKGLAVGLIGLYGRSAVASDLLAWQMAQGTMAEPKEGAVVGKNAKGEDVVWAAVEAGKEGWIENRALSGGYLYMAVDSARPRTMILDATGFYVAWVNGEPRGGEKYGADYLRHPVRLIKGRNVLLFRGERGRFKGRLYEPPADVFFTDKDMTLPDLVLGEKGPVWAGLRLVNATGERLERIEVLYRTGGREEKAAIGVSVAPLLTQKLAVPLAIDAPAAEGAVKIEIRARARAGRRTVETPPFAVELRAVPPSAHHSRTFVSGIDGSVQYFGVVPMAKGEGGEKAGTAPTKPALVLTLHGASVEAHRAGARLQAEGLVLDRGRDQPPALRLRLGGLGPARRARGPGRGPAPLRDRPGPDLPHGTLHGRPRHLADRRDGPRSVGGHRPERRLAQLLVLRRRGGLQGPDAGRDDAGPGEQSERNDGPGPQFPPLWDLRPPRRHGRQRARDPGPRHAGASREVPSRFRLLREAGRRPLVGERVRRLAAALPVPEGAGPAGGRRGQADRIRHGGSGDLGGLALGRDPGPEETARAEQGRDRARRVGESVQGDDGERRAAGDRYPAAR